MKPNQENVDKIKAFFNPEGVLADKQSKNTERMVKFLDEMKGEKGDKGDMPVKGQDYFTQDEMEHFGRLVLQAATPQKGVHYKDGERGPQGPKGDNTPIKGVDYFDGIDGLNGRDGIDADEEKIIEIVLSKIKIPKDGKDGKSVSVKDVIKALKELPEEEKLDISHIRNSQQLLSGLGKRGTGYKLTDQRWHGAGTSGSTTAYVDSFTTTGGSQAITLTHTPATVLTADVNGAVIYVTTDYTLSGTTLTLLNTDTPAGLTGKIAYLY